MDRRAFSFCPPKSHGSMNYLTRLFRAGRGLLQRKSLQNLALYGGTTSLGQFFMFVYTLLVARSLGPEQFGAYVSCYAATGLSAFTVNLGLDTWILRESASTSNLASLAGGVLRNKAVVGMGWAALLVAGLPLIRPDVFSPLLLLVCAIDLWCDSCLNTQIACLNVQRRINRISNLVLISRLGRLLGAGMVLLLGLGSPLLFAGTRALFSVLALVVSWSFNRPFFTGLPSFTSIFKGALPYAASELLAQIYIQADVTILALMSTRDATGLYSTASGMINALFVIPSAGYLLAIPSLSRLESQAPEKLNSAFKRYFLGFLGLGGILLVATLGFGAVVMEALLGAKYHVSGQLFSLMSPILFLKSIGFCCAAILVSLGLQRKRLVPQAASAAVNVVLNILVIPIAGIYGVAIVYIISEVVLTVGYGATVLLQLRKKSLPAF
jgi:O-antigen/teichoic acid export membrane protein